jgi:amino acid transporter
MFLVLHALSAICMLIWRIKADRPRSFWSWVFVLVVAWIGSGIITFLAFVGYAAIESL